MHWLKMNRFRHPLGVQTGIRKPRIPFPHQWMLPIANHSANPQGLGVRAASGRSTDNTERLRTALSGPRIPGLDAIRAIAVLLVLLYHADVELVEGGLGVEIFFVLSGFLITWLLLGELRKSGNIALGPFYRRRAARLLPALFAYLLAGIALLLVFGKPVPWGAAAASALYVVNYYQAFVGAPTHFLSHCWSLAVEEQFYLLWPLLLVYACRRQWNLPLLLVATMASSWLLRCVLIYGFGASDEYLYRALETRGDQLAAGCLLAALLDRPGWMERVAALTRHRIALAACATAVLLSAWLTRGALPAKYLFGYGLEPILIAASIPMVIVSASGTDLFARLLNAQPVVLIGQISYGMYLFHPLFMYSVKIRVEAISSSLLLGVLASIMVVFAVAYASFRYYEQPMRVWINGGMRHGAPPPPPSMQA